MRGRWRVLGVLCCLALPAPAQPAPDGGVILRETFQDNSRHWRVDEYSRLADGGYVIEARNSGGYYRWLNEPTTLGDVTVRVEVEKRKGNNDGPLFGLLLRVQENWKNSYFFVINGFGGYLFGKFRNGSPSVLRQGSDAAIKPGGARNTLTVTAKGDHFDLAVNDQPLGTVTDGMLATGRVGLCVEAPAAVWFGNLVVTRAGAAGAEPGRPADGVVLFADDFRNNSGWAVDEHRTVSDGSYHLRNEVEGKSYLSWHPRTNDLADFTAQIEVRQVSGSPRALVGLAWRILDGEHFYFFVIGADGRYYAGLLNGGQTKVICKGRDVSVRAMGETNALGVRAEGDQFKLFVNQAETATFSDGTFQRGCIGMYLEQVGHAAFDNLRVMALPRPGAGGGWPTGRSVYWDKLDRNGQGWTWPEDRDHRFDQGGFCVRAPEKGSRTVIRQPDAPRGDGCYSVNARPVQGNLTGSYGLVVGANRNMDSFYYLLMNATGQWYVGRCRSGQFEPLGNGLIETVRAGDAGNDLQVTLVGRTMRYGINNQPLGTLNLDAAPPGAVGLHVENGVVACFRDLRAFEAPEEPRR